MNDDNSFRMRLGNAIKALIIFWPLGIFALFAIITANNILTESSKPLLIFIAYCVWGVGFPFFLFAIYSPIYFYNTPSIVILNKLRVFLGLNSNKQQETIVASDKISSTYEYLEHKNINNLDSYTNDNSLKNTFSTKFNVVEGLTVIIVTLGVFSGLGVFIYQIYFWLKFGHWISIKIFMFLEWLGFEYLSITNIDWEGLKIIITWILNLPLSISLVIFSFAMAILISYLDSKE